MKNTTLFLILILLFSCGSDKIYKTAAKKNNHEIPGQSAPPDMVFIPSTAKHIPSFYISTTEEPNINYVIYLQWLEHIFGGSYPSVVKKALPQSPTINSPNSYNDPFLQSYMTHPAFAYYPVVNLTWEQVDNYLGWKTDRLNEMILVNTGVINYNSDQKDEDNFNTDAYLSWQYEGSVRRNLHDSTTGGERMVSLSDGILFTGFRLPTEEEWDYVSSDKFQKQKGRKITNNEIPFHPFGKDYYTLIYGSAYGNTSNWDWNYSEKTLPLGISGYNVNDKFTEKFDYHKNRQPEQEIEGFTTIYDYNPKSYGVINMDNGVQEWVLDEYDESPNIGKHWLEVMEEGGFNTKDAAQLDEEGRYVQKTFKGEMNDFRFIGMDGNGKANEISHYRQNVYNTKEDIDYYSNRIESIEHNLGYKNKTERAVQKLEAELENEKKELAKLHKRMEKQQANPPELRQRVVKGGTWENPSLGRKSMLENTASSNVGFRAVLPYTGHPVHKGYKVKWGKNKMQKRY